MNKIEAIKSERDGLDVREAIDRFAKEGWEAITEDDVQRLKWYGIFLRNPTPGFFMIRVRIPNGMTSSYQARALATIAEQHGNGLIDLTTRQQAQLRHIRIESVPAVFEQLAAVGLNSMQTGMDNVRNIMGCPVAGLNPNEVLDASPVVKAFTDHIVGNREFTNLPRKFNVIITGCPDNCLHPETQDLALVPAEREAGGKREAGFNVLAGGKLGSGGYRIASPLDVFVRPEEAVEVCAAIVLLYRDHGTRGDLRTNNRLAFLLDEWGEARFRAEIEDRLKHPLQPAGADARKSGANEHAGIFRQKQPGLNFVGLKVAVGRITASDMHGVAALAERYGTGEIRISPAQALILPNIPDRRLSSLLDEPLLGTLPYNASEIFKGLVSCVGNDYCNLAVIETKSRALAVAQQLERTLSGVKPITMNWSGCPAGCGNHLVADIGLLGKRAKVNGKVVDAVDVFVGGRSGPDAKQAIKILEDVPCDKLASVLEGLVPYHTRDKLHRAGKGKPKVKAQAPAAASPVLASEVPT
jgi:ferredoxin-nitrite reductase